MGKVAPVRAVVQYPSGATAASALRGNFMYSSLTGDSDSVDGPRHVLNEYACFSAFFTTNADRYCIAVARRV
jgi:hypothetical protein